MDIPVMTDKFPIDPTYEMVFGDYEDNDKDMAYMKTAFKVNGLS